MPVSHALSQIPSRWISLSACLAVTGLVVLAAGPTTASGGAPGLGTTEVPFASTGTWTVPAGVTTVDLLVVGGGGAGDGATSGGGGGGEVKVCAGVAVTEGQVLTATVGDGGTAGTAGSNYNGGDGGTSSTAVGASPACSANGGQGGRSGGSAAAPNYYSGGPSGNGTAGGSSGNSQGGGGGGGAGTAGGSLEFDPVNYYAFAGDGGSGVTPASRSTPGLFADVTATFYGGGGGGGTAPIIAGTGNAGAGGNGGGGAGLLRVPSAPLNGEANTGGGGGGGSGASSGGNGGAGYVVVRHVPPSPTPTPPGPGPTPPGPTPKPSNAFVLTPSGSSTSSLQSVITTNGPGVALQQGSFSSLATARSAKRLTACSDSKKITKAGRYKLGCTLTSAVRSARRRGSVRVLLRTTFTPTGGAARTITRVVTLKKTSSGVTG